MRDKGETSVNSCGPKHPEWETSVGDKGETTHAAQGTQSGRQGGDSYAVRHPEWETRVGNNIRHQEWETSVGDNCKLMRPKSTGVGDMSERQV